MTNRTRLMKRFTGGLGLGARILVPAVVVLAVVVGAAAIKGWPILPFIQASGPKYDPADWCREHGVPESLCTLCHPELKEKLLWCKEHGLPEELCTLCHPELAEGFVMCAEHGLPESYCTVCNPPVAGSDPKPDWCAAHGVPESKCTLCNHKLAVALCREHGVPESVCTLCNPELAAQLPTCKAHGLPPAFCPTCKDSYAASAAARGGGAGFGSQILLPQGPKSVPLCRLDLPLVKLASARTSRDAGIKAVQVQTRALARKITCNGQATYHQNHFAQVRPRVEGIVREVRVEAGAKVRRGDVLAVVDSLRLGQAKAGYLSSLASLDLAEKNFGRLQGLAEKQIIPGKSLLEAETRLSEARIRVTETRQQLLNLSSSKFAVFRTRVAGVERSCGTGGSLRSTPATPHSNLELLNLGIFPSDTERLVQTQQTGSLLLITAPLDGVVVRRHAVQGEAVQATTELFAVADLTTMWVHLDLYEHDLRWVRQGQPATFTVESLPGSDFPGKVTWISPEVNARTRTIQVRVEVENQDGLLRSGMYGSGTIQIEAPGEAQVVPNTAVQWHEGSPLIFVKRAEDLFEPRRVSIGRKEGPFWEVTVGIKPHELVVTTGSFLLKTELMKGSIGAGCCGD